VTISDVAVQLFAAEQSKPLDHRRGSLLFTHFGLSGPVVLDISRSFAALQDTANAKLHCDFLPDLPAEHLQEELRRAASADGKRLIANVLAERLPKRLAEALLLNAGLTADQRAAEFSKLARADLVRAVKSSEIPITGTRGFAKAEVTAGGVALDEIDSHTMESKLAAGLFFAGEILDLDGPIGGYNFQAAFSTGLLAGRSALRS
jgi:predicted Rossmann fold flavoprotein